MKRTVCLFLVLWLCLTVCPAAFATELPDDSFFWQHRGECQWVDRDYIAVSPDATVEAYVNPGSTAVAGRVSTGERVRICYTYEDENGVAWGLCEYLGAKDWTGWFPMDYLVLVYDHICFQEEFADRITERSGSLGPSGEERFFQWSYPGSDTCMAHPLVEIEYPMEYDRVFTDDAGREWCFVPYYKGIRNTWVCLDAPAADYATLYAEHAPQQVTHPTPPDTVPAGIKPSGPSLGGILSAVCVIAILSGGFLWATRKKK